MILFVCALTLVRVPCAHALDSDIDLFIEPTTQDHWDIPARIDSQVRASKDRTLNITEYWRPVWQSPDRVIFGTARLMSDNQSNFEGSLGVGARGFYTDHIWGTYLYADRRFTSLGSEFWQGTAGIEYIKDTIEMRSNIYIPTRRRTVHTTGIIQTPILVGTGIYSRGTSEIIEEAQPGMDAEIGFKIPDFSKYIGTSRTFAGVYYFKGDVTEDVAGARVRFTTDLSPFASIGGRAQYDDVRGAQYFLELTLRLPGAASRPDRPSLWSRLGDTPERDVDIVTVDHDMPGALTPLIDQETNAPARFIYVDNTADPATASGTTEHPFTKISDAVNVLQSNDTLYIRGDQMEQTPYTENITIPIDHVTIQGSGAPLILSNTRYTSSDFKWTGDLVIRTNSAAPIISTPNGNALTLMGNTQTVRGINFDGNSGSGIMITDQARNIIIDNVSSTGNGTHGIAIYASNAQDPMNVKIHNSIISGNLLYGVLADQPGLQKIHLNLGDSESFGGNDLFGNITGNLYANTPGGTVMESGNYKDLGGALNIVGPTAGAVYSGVIASDPYHEDAKIITPGFSPWIDTINETTPYISPSIILSEFTGSRYLAISAMDSGPMPEFILNNTPTATAYVRVQPGGQIGFQIMPHPSHMYTRFITVTGGGFDQFIGLQTQ